MALEQRQRVSKEQLQVPYHLLTQIFKRFNLQKPDDRMLCQYRCTDAEYSDSQEYLCQQSAQDSFSPVDSIIFCLYTSEWWRRNYVSGPWKWDGVFESIGLPANLSRNRIPEMVKPGLDFFNRKILILNGQSRYFATLATEGGLPLKLLSREKDAHLQRYLRALLREFQIYGIANSSAIDLARKIGVQLPKSLQHSGLFQICGGLVQRIWQLQSKLGDTSTPIEDLDRIEPDWRNSFPLVVSDEVAEALLNSLVKEAVKIARIQEIKFAIILKKTSNGFQLERKIRIPPSFDARSLAAILGMEVQNLPYRIQLYLNQSTGDRDLLGLITRRIGGDEGRFAIEFPNESPIVLQDSKAAASVWLEARSGNLSSELRNIKGSLGLSDLPWVFAVKDDTANQYELIGEGGLKTKFSEIFIAVSPDSEIQANGSECSLVAEDSVLGRNIYRVSGTVVISSNGNRSTIYTKSEEEDIVQYVLSGELLSSGTFGSNIYIGFPRIICFSGNGVVTSVSPERMQWKTRKGSDPWKTSITDCYGPVKIRLSINGETRFMADIDVVPSGSSIYFKPGMNARVGSIEIKGMKAIEYGTSQPQSVQIVNKIQNDVCTLECVSSDVPPAKFTVHVRWYLGQELSLQVPYPAKGVRFIGRDGTILMTDETVHISRLSGVLVRVMELSPHVNYFVDATVVAKKLSGLKHEGLRLAEVAPGRHEIDLRQLQEGCNLLFSAVDDLDALIRVSVTSSDGASFPQKIYIARYDVSLVPNKELGEVQIAEEDIKTLGDDIANIDLRAFPLMNPMIEPVMLPKLADSRWSFESASRDLGPWLITGWDGDWCRIRPLCWTIFDDSVEVQENTELSLDKIVRIPDQRERLIACVSLLDALTDNPGHSDWKKIESYFLHMRHLPPNTFDIIVKMARHQLAAPTALLRVGDDLFDDVWTGLERLPFAWYLVPVESWLRSAKLRAEYLSAALSPMADTLEEDIGTIVERSFKGFFDQAPVRVPGLQPVVELIKHNLFKTPLQQLQYLPMVCNRANRQMLKEMFIMPAMQGLLQLHSEDHWPTCHELSEEWWPQQYGAIPEELHELWIKDTSGAGYRSGILDAPIVAAFASAFGIKLPKKFVFQIRRMRDFDITWFDASYGCALAICIGCRLENQQEFIQ